MSEPVAMVTGAGRGIGAAIARRLHADGCHIVVGDIDATSATAVADELSGEASVFDVADSAAVDTAVDSIVASHGRLDVVVNNAGILAASRDVIRRFIARLNGAAVEPLSVVSTMTDEAWDRTLKVHLYGTFYVTRAALRHMEPVRSGTIVNIASVYSMAGRAMNPDYAVAKGGIAQLTRSVGAEVAALGIRVNAVAPGFVGTDLIESSPAPIIDDAMSQTPAGRFATPDEVADAVAFLASDRASFCNGEIWTVSGGWSAS